MILCLFVAGFPAALAQTQWLIHYPWENNTTFNKTSTAFHWCLHFIHNVFFEGFVHRGHIRSKNLDVDNFWHCSEWVYTEGSGYIQREGPQTESNKCYSTKNIIHYSSALSSNQLCCSMGKGQQSERPCSIFHLLSVIQVSSAKSFMFLFIEL